MSKVHLKLVKTLKNGQKLAIRFDRVLKST